MARAGADNTAKHFQAMTMIDPVTGWFEMGSWDDPTPEAIVNLLEIHWLSRHPRPSVISADRGGEFVGQFFKKAISEDYGIERRLITTANPQAACNAVVERVHQVTGNMLRTMGVANCHLLPPPHDPWAGLMAAIAFAIRSSWHASMRATPGQLAFGRDMMLNVRHLANWHCMQSRRQSIASGWRARES